MTWDSFYSVSQILAVLFAGLALVSGLVVNKRQSQTILGLKASASDAKAAQQSVELRLEEQREKTAKAELLIKNLEKRQGPRINFIGELIKALDGCVAGSAEIRFQEGDGEVAQFASWLKSVMKRAGWNVQEPQPVGDTVSGSLSGISLENLRAIGPVAQLGAHPTGVTIVANGKTMESLFNKDVKNSLKDLLNALNKAGIKASVGQEDSQLPDGLLRVIVAPR